MNVVSNNYIADVIFDKVGGKKAYHTYLQNHLKKNFKNYTTQRQDFKKSEHSISFYTGSGLNQGRGTDRLDNYATCALMVSLVKELDVKIAETQLKIENYVAVPGVDKGTFSRRLNTPRISKSLIAKTGTLMNTSALLGKISTKKGQIYFGFYLWELLFLYLLLQILGYKLISFSLVELYQYQFSLIQ